MIVLVVCIKNRTSVLQLALDSHTRTCECELACGWTAWLRQPYASLLIAGYLSLFLFFYVRLYVTANVN